MENNGIEVNEQEETLTDLTVAEANEEAVKGGPGSGAGGVWLNHNETLIADENKAEDNEEQLVSDTLNDLSVADQQAAQTKGKGSLEFLNQNRQGTL